MKNLCFTLAMLLRWSLLNTARVTAMLKSTACFHRNVHTRRPSFQTFFVPPLHRRSLIRRQASTSTEPLSTLEDEEDERLELLHPENLSNGTIPYPKALSPSSILEFKRCPQSFLFQYLYGLRQPTSLALCKGSMCHSALEKLFDLEPEDRTLEHLQNLFRSVWSDHRLKDQYRQLFEQPANDTTTTMVRDLQAEGDWGRESLQLLENYYRFEDPRTIPRPNPVQREIWVKAHLTVDPRLGRTGYVVPKDYELLSTNGDDTFFVRGIVDRLDMIRISPYQVALRIVDYKSGKAPNLKYSAAMNQKIADEAFYQLKIYALLLREKGDDASSLDLRYLRLLFLTSESGQAQSMDLDLGETADERDRILQDTHADLSNVWTSIVDLVSQQDPKAFVGCDRSFCYCHKCRERFVPGTVWEP